MSAGLRMVDVPVGMADKIFVGLRSRIQRKVNLDDHTDVLLTEYKSTKHIVVKKSYGGDVHYSEYTEAEFNNLAACVSKLLAAAPKGTDS